MNPAVKIPFDNTYLNVADALFSKQLPTAVEHPGLIRINEALAELLFIDPEQLRGAEGVAVLAGNAIPAGAEPIATVYAGHQFGNWNPQLGDGRAILLGEVVAKDGYRYDLQLKGAGQTPYSRMGDGRSPLGPVLREYIVSEAMAVLGVPTTRSLAAVTTGEKVARDQFLPGAILTRVARSHIRVGTFQYFSARQDLDSLTRLADHVISRHYPEAGQAANPYVSLLSQVVEAQAKLIAQWQSIGFIHGVMNTDNMLVSGETVDYGPCAFMENYDPETVFSSIDHAGRYAYSNQPPIAHWNLAWLAQSLLPLVDSDETKAIQLVQEALDNFKEQFLYHYNQRMCAKIGVAQVSEEANELVAELLAIMAKHQVDFTLGFRVLAEWLFWDRTEQGKSAIDAASLYTLPDEMQGWVRRWHELLALTQRTAEDIAAIARGMHACNPVFIPRNHQIEFAIQAGNAGDLEPFHRLVEVLSTPFEFDAQKLDYAMPATPDQRVLRTFCGT
ncbi:YdiU family protein [Aestuariicella hydrocarbonica]|uniref:Protein nucleotidyltransferase YdiU n=1 Tax=Pseudomaricurvus hydrocarbonicus TaxID=1470433 RepID=A0A9E5T4A2_9GAMM|nr:YdiU family protein [Aestuariicella hydrocarbonica]NHO67817.1 YdiU family protein [Aestuariicella hydrocarbonica]